MAEIAPLRIAIPHFYPPYVLTDTGFDIVFMTRICEIIQRNCKFLPMKANDIIPAIASNKVDLGIGAITITLDRYRFVNFSIPYLLSESRFLRKKVDNNTQLNVRALSTQTIGVPAGSSFAQQLKIIYNVQNSIKSFADINELIASLINGSIDIALMDNATAVYWQNHSSNQLQVLGTPFVYGFGIGIAANQDNTVLLKVIDLAILQEQDSNNFKQIYGMYFESF